MLDTAMTANIGGIHRRALIFGGFGMEPKHCSQLATLYQKFGAHRVTPLCHSLQQMTVPRLGDRQARKLAREFALLGHHDDVVVHLFSGAVFIFFRMLGYLPEQARQAIRAVIFECSPMDCRAEQFGRFVSWRLDRNYGAHFAAPFLLLRPMAGITRRFEARHRQDMRRIPARALVHFVLCEDDPIIDPDYVEAYRQELTALGHVTSMTIHSGARHCRALTDCRADYQADIAQLLGAHWKMPRSQADQPEQREAQRYLAAVT